MKRFICAWAVVLISSLTACAGESTPIAVVESTSTPTPTSTFPEEGSESSKASPTVASTVPGPDVTATGDDEDSRLSEREIMVERGVIDWGVQEKAVHEAMLAVPRHEFVPEDYASEAYENHPLPIGYGQTISQPFIVGLMSEAIDPAPEFRVLEIGTGSGYQAAVLAELVDQVFSVEIIGPLHERAQETLLRVGYDNVTLLHADGYFGWEEHAPFDAIVVTAAPDHIPQPLVQQLKIGGKMIIPVGPVGGFQNLWLITRVSDDRIETKDLGGVRFVPFTREEE